MVITTTDIVLLLKKILLFVICLGAGFLTFYSGLFTAIAFLVPTSSPYQVEEWSTTKVVLFGGISITKLWLVRLQLGGIGLLCTLALFAVTWFTVRGLRSLI